MKSIFLVISILCFLCGMILIFFKGEEGISHLIKSYEGAPLFILTGVILLANYFVIKKIEELRKN